MTSSPSFNTIDIFYRMKTQTPLGRMTMTMTLTIKGQCIIASLASASEAYRGPSIWCSGVSEAATGKDRGIHKITDNSEVRLNCSNNMVCIDDIKNNKYELN